MGPFKSHKMGGQGHTTIQTRWGSYNVQRKNINLNLELIKKPRYCIEYVILHELAT